MEEQTPKTKSNTSTILILLAVIVFILVAVNWQSIYRTFAPPKPIVVSTAADHSSSTLLEYSAKIWAEVRNDGGDGTIAMEATFSQNGKTFTKTTTKYFKSLETLKMEIVFDEAEFLGGESNYSVNVFPYGK